MAKPTPVVLVGGGQIAAANTDDLIEQCKLIERPENNLVARGGLLTSLEGYPGFHKDTSSIYTKPNANHSDPKSIEREALGSSSQCAVKSSIGNLIPEGCVGIYEHNGKTKLVSPGRYLIWNWRCNWVKYNQQLNEDVIKHKTLMIVRVATGKVGLALDNGNPLILAPGTHVFNKGTTVFLEFKNMNEQHLRHGNFQVLRVPRGQYAKVWVPDAHGSLVPRLLHEGLHVMENALFKVDGFVKVREEYIQHGSVNVMQVAKGRVAKILHENKPRLLGAGDHMIESTNFEYCGIANLSDKIIQHRTMTIARIPLGEIGVAWDKNEPLFIDKAGLYAMDSPDFMFIRHVSANERVIELGAKKIVMVYTGEVGISYDHGELKILNHGRHLIDASTHLFEGFLSTQQKSIRLATKMEKRKSVATLKDESTKTNESHNFASATRRNQDEDLMACETKDLVKVGIRADVFYSIMDPQKAISRIRVDEIEDLVRETAIATLTNIIRSTALNEIAQSKLPSAVSGEKQMGDLQHAQAMNAPSAPLFFDKAHDEFLSKLHDDFIQRYGLDIANIRIESFKIMDDELADSISKQALVTAQTENELANLQGKTEIATAEQHRLAEVQNIAAEAEARALKTKTDAENQRKIEAAKAEAEAKKLKVKLEAEAEAEATIMKAKAEAEAIRLVAEAEAKRSEMLSKTTLGAQTSLLQIYSEMVKSSNEGVEKIVYCDPTLQQAGSAFSLPVLQNLNRDLQVLGGISSDAGSIKNQSFAETVSTNT